jgi:hypothetical protein
MGRNKLSARKASWLAFGLVTLAVASGASPDTLPDNQASLFVTTAEVFLFFLSQITF